MKKFNYTLGAKPSPKDVRDYPLSKSNRIVKEVMAEEYLPFAQMTIKNQGQVGKCVAAANAAIREDREFRQSGIITSFAEDFIYANRQPTDWQDSGMYPREAKNALLKTGVVPSDYFSFPNKEYAALKPLLDAMLATLEPLALPHRISAYYRTNTNYEREVAATNLGSQTLTLPIYESFFDTGADGIVPEPKGELVGYHEIAYFGWRKDVRWACQNSWGYWWGNRGRFYYHKDYPIIESWADEDDILPEKEGEILTQEQFNAMLQNYFEMLDAKPPSEWSATERGAVEAAGLIVGDSNGRKRYKAHVSREELAIILYRMMNK